MPDERTLFLAAAVVLTLSALIYVHRALVGPTVFDRLVASSGVATKTILLLILIGGVYGELDMVVDIALGYALLNFVATVASARYFEGKTET